MRISDWSSDVCSSDLVVGQLIGSDQRRNILQRLKIDVLCRNRSPCDGNGPEDCSSQSCRSPQSPPFHSFTIRPPSEATSQRPASATPPLESRRTARPDWYLKDRSQTRTWRENKKESPSACLSGTTLQLGRATERDERGKRGG